MAEIGQWEYRVQNFGTFWSVAKEEAMEAELNAWGAEGWEVVGVAPIENTNKLRVIAKRPATGRSIRVRSFSPLPGS